jgi:hypothetical protein
MTAPIFILASPRSGSTLFRVMLAGHPDLFCPPELNLLPFQSMAERDDVLDQCSWKACQDAGCDERAGLLRALMELTGDDLAGATRRVADLIRDGASTIDALHVLARLAEPRTLVDKSPLNVVRLAWLRRAESIGPNVRYLHLVRHPAAVIESRVRHDTNLAQGPEATLIAEQRWAMAQDTIATFLAGIDPSRHLLVRYEDVVTRTRQTMRGVLDFLGLPVHEAVLDPYTGNRMTDGVREGLPSLGDPSFLARGALDPALADAWRSARLPFGLGEPTVELAHRFGYDTSLTALPGVSRELVRDGS